MHKCVSIHDTHTHLRADVERERVHMCIRNRDSARARACKREQERENERKNARKGERTRAHARVNEQERARESKREREREQGRECAGARQQESARENRRESRHIYTAHTYTRTVKLIKVVLCVKGEIRRG